MGKDSDIAGSSLHSCSKRLVQLLLQMTSLAMAALLLAACILPRAYKYCELMQQHFFSLHRIEDS